MEEGVLSGVHRRDIVLAMVEEDKYLDPVWNISLLSQRTITPEGCTPTLMLMLPW